MRGLPIQAKKLLRQKRRVKVLNKLLYRRIKSPTEVHIFQFIMPKTLKRRMMDYVLVIREELGS